MECWEGGTRIVSLTLNIPHDSHLDNFLKALDACSAADVKFSAEDTFLQLIESLDHTKYGNQCTFVSKAACEQRTFEAAVALRRQDVQREKNDKRNGRTMEAALATSQTRQRKGEHQAAFFQKKKPKHFKSRRGNAASPVAIHQVNATNTPPGTAFVCCGKARHQGPHCK